RLEVEREPLPLESCSDHQVSRPELATVAAKQTPLVLLASNNSRERSEALMRPSLYLPVVFFCQARDGIRDRNVTGVQTCALPIYRLRREARSKMGPAGTPAVARATERLRDRWVKDRLVERGRAHANAMGFSDIYSFTKAMAEQDRKSVV